MKEMLEANVPIHFLTSCKISNASSSQTRDRISAKRAAGKSREFMVLL